MGVCDDGGSSVCVVAGFAKGSREHIMGSLDS